MGARQLCDAHVVHTNLDLPVCCFACHVRAAEALGVAAFLLWHR